MEKRKIVEAEVDCDTGRLYGTIDEAIAYLIEVRDKHRGIDIGLDEHWTGYEDMMMRFTYTREENDDEYARRMQREAWEREAAAERKAKEAARAEYEKEHQRLKKRLGI